MNIEVILHYGRIRLLIYTMRYEKKNCGLVKAKKYNV